jgi:hypothetical protein
MIPEAICVHFTLLDMGCELDRFAPRDCSGCSAYYDGSAFLGVSAVDQTRLERWLDFPRVPAAHFRGQGNV